MGGIDNQPYVVLAAQCNHLWHVKTALQPHAMQQFHLLTLGACAVVVGAARLFEHLHGLTPFCRPSEYQYH